MPWTGPSSSPASKLMGGGAGAFAASAAAWPRRFVLANADAMAAASKQFHKGARQLKRFKVTQQAKLGAAAGLAVTAGVAVVAVPVVAAIL